MLLKQRRRFITHSVNKTTLGTFKTKMVLQNEWRTVTDYGAAKIMFVKWKLLPEINKLQQLINIEFEADQ